MEATIDNLNSTMTASLTGTVAEAIGMTVSVADFPAPVGAVVRIERDGSGPFRVTGEPIERLFARFDVAYDEALAHVGRRMKRMGVLRAREAAGFQPGDDVEVAGIGCELDPS